MNKIIAVLAVILTFFSITTPAEAFGRGRIFGRGRFFNRGGCGHVFSCNHCCETPVIVEDIVEVPVFAFPVLVPAYQFQYVPPAYAPAAFPVAGGGYPVVQSGGYGATYGQFGQYGQYGQSSYGQYGQATYGQPQANYGAYGQSPYAANQSLNLNNRDRIRELARALLEEMSKAENGNGNGNDTGPPAVPGTQSYQPPQNPYQPPYQPQPPYQSQQPPPQQLQQVAFSAMARTCARCHTGVGSKHDMVIFTQPGLLNQHANWRKIRDEVASGRTPPPKEMHFQLAPQERQAIVQWLNSIGVN